MSGDTPQPPGMSRDTPQPKPKSRAPIRLMPVAWASLVVTAGPAVADALQPWSTPPRLLAGVLLWAVWGGVLLAILAPRPFGLTVVRVAAALAVVLAAAALPSAGALAGTAALAGTGLAAGLTLAPSVGYRFVNGAAY